MVRFVIQQLSADDEPLMNALLSMFGGSFEDVDTYRAKRPEVELFPAFALQRLLHRVGGHRGVRGDRRPRSLRADEVRAGAQRDRTRSGENTGARLWRRWASSARTMDLSFPSGVAWTDPGVLTGSTPILGRQASSSLQASRSPQRDCPAEPASRSIWRIAPSRICRASWRLLSPRPDSRRPRMRSSLEDPIVAKQPHRRAAGRDSNFILKIRPVVQRVPRRSSNEVIEEPTPST